MILNVSMHNYMQICMRWQDSEVLQTWLAELHLDDTAHLFLQAGYDMPTISRMTPEVSEPSFLLLFAYGTMQSQLNKVLLTLLPEDRVPVKKITQGYN